jgi:Flp pilus assembly pilin Flp
MKMWPQMRAMRISSVMRLAVEEDGQDLIEYALLTSAIGFAGVAGFNLIGLAINAVYASWDAGVNDLWEPPDPA